MLNSKSKCVRTSCFVPISKNAFRISTNTRQGFFAALSSMSRNKRARYRGPTNIHSFTLWVSWLGLALVSKTILTLLDTASSLNDRFTWHEYSSTCSLSWCSFYDSFLQLILDYLFIFFSQTVISNYLPSEGIQSFPSCFQVFWLVYFLESREYWLCIFHLYSWWCSVGNHYVHQADYFHSYLRLPIHLGCINPIVSLVSCKHHSGSEHHELPKR